MLGEGNEPPYPSPTATGPFPPDTRFARWGDRPPSVATPARARHSLRSLGGPTSVIAAPAKPDTRFARWGDRPPSSQPPQGRTRFASLEGPPRRRHPRKR